MDRFSFIHGKRIDLTTLSIEGDNVRLVSINLSFASEVYKEFTREITRYMAPKPADDISGLDAIRTVENWAANHIKFDYAIYPVDKNTMASRKIPEALGGTVFRKETLESMSGNILDEVVYKIPYSALC